MRDFPIFTTDYGVSNLTLREIPYKKQAFIRILDVQEAFFSQHLEECVKFCKMAGAEKVFGCGSEKMKGYPVHTSVLEMRGTAWRDVDKMENLFPVTDTTVSQWRSIYNERMRNVDNAMTLESRDEKRILESGGAYFVHRCGQLLGIGWMEDTKLLAVASVVPGMGERVMHTLMSLVEGDTMQLEVASTNQQAIRLYEKLGFMKTAEIDRWYRITEE